MNRDLDRAGLGALLARPGVQTVLAALDTPGEETRLIGGCVRDALLGSAASDIDLATTLLPEAVVEKTHAAGLKAVPTGIEHGTITVVTPHEPVEVTTLREDVETDGRHAVVRFGGDFAQDAARRDFTINALSLGADGRLHDTTGGLDDLRAGRVRFIGEAETRIREDALRILRFFRFHARFSVGAPDAAALAACIKARDAIDGLSRERVRAEFLKLLIAPGCVAVTEILSETGLLQRITGGVGELGRLARSAAVGQPAPLRLAALGVHACHDVDWLRDRLRLSKAETARLDAYAAALAVLHARREIDATEARALAAVHGSQAIRDTLAILQGEPQPRLSEAAVAELISLEKEGRDPVFPLVGADLVAAGIPAGRAIGRALATAKTEWLAFGCPEDEETRQALLTRAIATARD